MQHKSVPALLQAGVRSVIQTVSTVPGPSLSRPIQDSTLFSVDKLLGMHISRSCCLCKSCLAAFGRLKRNRYSRQEAPTPGLFLQLLFFQSLVLWLACRHFHNEVQNNGHEELITSNI
jgi:hypothetical protein